MDASRYLERFFDLHIPLPVPDIQKYYEKVGMKDTPMQKLSEAIGLADVTWTYNEVCQRVIETFHFELREMAKYYQLARIVLYKSTYIESQSSIAIAFAFCQKYILPVMLGLMISDVPRYSRFIGGANGEPLYIVMKRVRFACRYRILASLGISDDENDISAMQNMLIAGIKSVYNALFNTEYSLRGKPVHVGQMVFTQHTRDRLMKVASGLSDRAGYYELEEEEV